MEDERNLFEQWAKAKKLARLNRYADGEYQSDFARSAWLAWQARAKEAVEILTIADKGKPVEHCEPIYVPSGCAVAIIRLTQAPLTTETHQDCAPGANCCPPNKCAYRMVHPNRDCPRETNTLLVKTQPENTDD